MVDCWSNHIDGGKKLMDDAIYLLSLRRLSPLPHDEFVRLLRLEQLAFKGYLNTRNLTILLAQLRVSRQIYLANFMPHDEGFVGISRFIERIGADPQLQNINLQMFESCRKFLARFVEKCPKYSTNLGIATGVIATNSIDSTGQLLTFFTPTSLIYWNVVNLTLYQTIKFQPLALYGELSEDDLLVFLSL